MRVQGLAIASANQATGRCANLVVSWERNIKRNLEATCAQTIPGVLTLGEILRKSFESADQRCDGGLDADVKPCARALELGI